MTVVDGAAFLEELYAVDIKRRGWAVGEGMNELAQLLRSVEFANVIIMNKMDLMEDRGRKRLRAYTAL